MDRGLRIQKIRSWVSSQEWPDDIKKKTLVLLEKKVKTGDLSSASSVVYDKKKCEIQKIQCLKLVYPIDVSGADSEIPIDVLFQKNDRKTKRSSKT